MLLLFTNIVLAAVLVALTPPGGYPALEFPALYTGPEFDPARWSATAREQVFFGLGLDYLFLCAYSLLLHRWCQALARRLPPISSVGTLLRRAGRWVWVAGFFDVVENTGIYFWLSGKVYPFLKLGISACAGAKFLILALVLVALLVGLLVRSTKRRA
jgi:hypothetical protein